MITKSLFEDLALLPPEAQREVQDFVGFLKTRYICSAKKKISRNEPRQFIGMWKNRKEWADSVSAVRSLRDSEWGV